MKYFILLSIISILVISCQNEIPTSTSISLKLKDNSQYVDVTDLKSFKIVIEKDGEEIDQSKCLSPSGLDSAENRTIGFHLDSGTYTFIFSGSSTSTSCSDIDWYGKTESTIVSSQDNYVSILISRLESFTLSTLTLPSPKAFFEINKIYDDNILSFIISGGAEITYSRLNRIDPTPLESNDCIDCICRGTGDDETCYSVISYDNCIAQGGDQEICTKCLEVSNKAFLEPDQACIIPCNNQLSNTCSLLASRDIIKIDPNNRESYILEASNGTPLKIAQPKIFHKTKLTDSNTLHIFGGAGLLELKNESPYYFPIRYNSFNYEQVAWSDLSTFSNSENILDGNILTDFLILSNSDGNSYLSGGTLSGSFDRESDFNNKMFSCSNSSSPSCSSLDQFENLIKLIGGSSICIDTNCSQSLVAGGIPYPIDSTNIFTINSNGDKEELSSDSNIDLFRAQFHKIDNKLFLSGGLTYSINNDTPTFNTPSKKIIAFDSSDLSKTTFNFSQLENILYPEIIKYTYNDQEGLLIVGGVDISDGNFKPNSSVYFFNPSQPTNLQLIGELNLGRFGHKVIIDDINRVWVIGGIVENSDNHLNLTNSIEIFNRNTY